MLWLFMVLAKNLEAPVPFAQVSQSQRNLRALGVSALDFGFPDFFISPLVYPERIQRGAH